MSAKKQYEDPGPDAPMPKDAGEALTLIHSKLSSYEPYQAARVLRAAGVLLGVDRGPKVTRKEDGWSPSCRR